MYSLLTMVTGMVLAELCDLGSFIDFCLVAYLTFWVCNCLWMSQFYSSVLAIAYGSCIEFLGFTLQYFQLLMEDALNFLEKSKWRNCEHITLQAYYSSLIAPKYIRVCLLFFLF